MGIKEHLPFFSRGKEDAFRDDNGGSDPTIIQKDGISYVDDIDVAIRMFKAKGGDPIIQITDSSIMPPRPEGVIKPYIPEGARIDFYTDPIVDNGPTSQTDDQT